MKLLNKVEKVEETLPILTFTTPFPGTGSPRGQSYKINLTKSDHFIICTIFSSTLKWTTLEKRGRTFTQNPSIGLESGTVFTTLHFFLNLQMGPIS